MEHLRPATGRSGRWFLAVAVVLLGACARQPAEYPSFLPTTPHERYEFAFRQIGLERTALGHEWIAASRRALHGALAVETPFREVGYLDPRSAESFGYAVHIERGQRLIVRVEVRAGLERVFLDLYRVVDDTLRPHQHVANADSNALAMEFFARRTGTYIVRLQPELLGGGRFEVTLIKTASLAFPIKDRDMRSIRSRFGASRDGGRREHHGVDIFAPRGTPVVAAAPGRIRSTRPNRLGGNVVWLRDDRGNNLYYAHLDSVTVRRGSDVAVGDTLGFVGNTGNARTTPPHLHFGIYAGGPTDPWYFLLTPPAVPAALVADGSVVGGSVRSGRLATRVYGSPARGADVVAEIARHTPMHVMAGTGGWYRVSLPDSTTGYVAAEGIEPADTPLRTEVLGVAGALVDHPRTGGVVIDSMSVGATVAVLGRFGRFALVEVAADGRAGWIADLDSLAKRQSGAPALASGGTDVSVAAEEQQQQ